MANGTNGLKAPWPFLLFALVFAVFQARGVRVGQCPDFPRKLSQNCPPHSTVDQCKYDEDCTENNQQKCCKIGCGKICLNPSDLASVTGNSVCPALPRPSPCPNEPNQCIDKSECGAGRECCSDGCRMICVKPVAIPTTAVKTFPWKSCNATVDVAFIIDSSGSIARRNYEKIKAFVKYIARSFGISATGSRAGIVLYSTTASVKAHFGQYPTTEEFNKAVDDLPHERGYTYIDKALGVANWQLFPRARKNVPKIAMLLTDGEQTDPDGTVNLRRASAPLRREGVRLIAFGVGKRINVRELRLVVERDEDVVRVMKFDDLITKVRNYTASLCQAAETEPIHPDADVIFLIDSSTDVSTAQFDMQKQFVRRMARYFIISPLGPRAAFVTYGSRSYTVIGFSGYSSSADFSLKINNARFLGGTRRIDQALNHAAKLFQETGRVGLRIVILLTAGNYYTGPGASGVSSVMMPLRSLDAHLYVIGIGSQFTPWMFTQMVRGPKDVFQIPSFNDLALWQALIARQLRLATNAFKYEPSYFQSDVIFLMDSSRYVSANNYILEKNFVKLMARLLNLANNRSRAALYTFSDHPQLQITFDGYEDREAFDAAVNNAPHLQGSRRIDRAFDSAAQLLRSKSQASVPKYVILLTTGTQTRAADTRPLDVTSRSIRGYGGRVFVVAILSGGYSIRDFYPAVQRPEDAFAIASFGDLLSRAPSISAQIMGSWRAPNVPNFAADISFILDSSAALTHFQYSRAKRFVRILSDYLNISPGKSRGSLVTFGETPVVVFNFDAYKTRSEFRNKVTGAPYLGGEPSVSSALRAAGTLFSDARGSYPWLAILVTPWRPKDIRDTKILEAAARPLLNRGVWLYVLSIGENPYVGWLRPMVVDPRDAFSVVSYRDLPTTIGPVASYITSDNYLYGRSTFQLDIVFLMDTSSGVDLNDYKIEKGFVQRIAFHLGVFHRKSRAAIVAYGANASVTFGFGDYSSNSEFLRLLNGAPSIGGERRVDRALDTAAVLLLDSRSTMPKAVILLMAGKQSSEVDSIPMKNAARPLHQLGAWVYIMAIGQTDASELQKTTIRPTDIFFARSFSGLYGYIAPVARYVANTSGTSTLNADIVFIIDCSSDVPYREYGTQKAFVRSLAQYLNVQPGQSRLALIAYGSRAMPVLRFDSSRTIVRFYSELTKAPYLGGNRRVDTALGIATRIFGNARENVPKVVLLFMAGKQSRVPGALTLQNSVQPLHRQGVRTFIFRIGSEPGIRELNSAVDRPENVITFASYADMDARVPSVARHIPFYSALLGPLSLAVDVVYLLDSSDSVTLQHYDDQKSFVKQLSRYLNTMPARARSAVITYGSTATVITEFGGTSTTQEFHNAINNAPKVGGPRRMDSAIDSARNVFAKARPAVPKVVILLTTGNQAAGIQAGVLDRSFQRLYDLGARLYAVTISPQFIILPLRGSAGSDWFPVRSITNLPVYVMPLARHVSYDTAALGPYDFDADVIFMLDSSSRVTPEDFIKEKEFVKLIARYLNITPGKSRGSVIVFSTDAIPILPFDGYSSMSGFNSIIDKAPQLSGKRRIDRAFGAAATLFQNARPSVRKIAILLTGGRQSPDGGSLEDAMQLMRNRDITTYVISIGERSDVPVQRPEDLFYVTSYSDLPGQVLSIATNVTAPKVTTTAPTTPIPTTPADPCKTDGCSAPYNVGCRVVGNKAQCICPSCPNVRSPVCASDDVQDLSECHMKRQACEMDIAVTVDKRAPCDKDCNAVVDIAFVIDSSGSIGRSNWERMKRFLKALVSKLDVSPSATHIAAVAYSTNPEVVMRFKNFQGTDQVNQVFDRMRWQRGYTYTDKALLLADEDLFQTPNGMRSNVPKMAVVITDGKQTTTGNYTSLSEASQGMKNKGVIVYVLGVGSGADRAELEEIASRTDYVSISPSFKDLLSISSGIRQLFCAVPTQAPKVTTTAPDPCVTNGCRAPYNIGCRVVDNKAQCICPTCPNVRKPVCASDDVQDLSECHLKRQACEIYTAVTVAKQGACDKECRTVVDIAFVIDSSGSIGRSNWERMKRFIKSLVSKLDVSPSATHVAALAYSNNPEVVMRFNDVQGTDEVNRDIDGMRWQRGYTYTDRALLLADTDLFQTSNGMRSNVPKLAFVITDGKQTKSSSYTELSVASRGMKNKGVIVYAVGVGVGADRAELEEIASGSEYVYTSASFTDLKELAPGIRKLVCEVPTKAPPVTTPMKPDVCETQGCSAPYNIGCRVVDNKAQCICPTCPNIRRPVCASDDVQDLSECHMKQQACQGGIAVTVTKQGQCDKECRSKLDIAFVIDSSGSIGRSNWERMKRFIKALISRLDVRASATHVAAVAYSTDPEVVTRFRSYQGTDHVNRLIDRMRWQRGFTYTDKALLLADRDLFQTSNGMRAEAPKLAVVITDGKQTTTLPYTRLSEASRGIKNKGVIVYAVGVGSGADRAELEEIASASEYVYTSTSFEDLKNIAPGIRKRLCEAIPTQTTTATPVPTTSDPCVAPGCNAPYNIGCQVVKNKAECVCPTCPNTLKPVCASDRVQDLSECHLRRQACQGNITVTVTKQGPCDKECSTVVDIAFVIDSSGSIGRSNWERMKRFIKSLVSKLDVSPSATHVAAVAYSTNPEVVMRFNDFQGTDQVNLLIDRMRWQRGFTYTDKALILANSNLFQTSTGMRFSVLKFAIVITDGKQTTTQPYTRLSEASRGMKNKGVIVYALGVGSGADRSELEEIASGPDYVFTSSSFKDLQNISSGITRRLCQESAQTTTMTPIPTTPDPCQTQGCSAPYNIGCRVVDNKPQCICPTCPNIRRPVCASDSVQDLSECHLRQQACLGDVTVAVAKQGPCDKECSTLVDIAFVIDSSGSIGRSNWERMKRFIKSLVSKLDVSPSATHIAAVAYSTNPEVVMRFNGFQGTDQVNQLIDRMRWQRGFTYTDKALLLANSSLFQTSTGMRLSALKFAIVITDGKQTTTQPYTRLSEASRGMKNKGVIVYALGVGSGADRAELGEIASGPEYVFTSSSFKDLQNISPGFTRRLCQESAQTTTMTPIPTTPDPCQAQGCSAPYNIGCRVVDDKPQCICPTCPNIRRPVCASDRVQDLSECHLRQQACLGDITVAVAKQGPCDKECSTVADIAFIIDSSGSIGRSNWERMKRFIKSFVSKLDVSPSATHVAAVAYSTNPEVVMRFNGFQGTDQVNQLIDRMRWQRGFTYTDKALIVANSNLFQTSTGMRLSALKFAIVITDGKQTTTQPYTRLSEASRGMKNKGVIVYALGVGSGADRSELGEIASGPKYVFTSSSFKDLQNISPGITRRLCQESAQTTTMTPTPTTPDPCQAQGCSAPYNIGCRVVDNKPQCICPTCPNTRRPVCASDRVQDLSECHLRQQACLGDITVAVAKQGPCDKECSTAVDIAFVIDSSGSIGRSNWERMKRFIKSLVSQLDVSPSATHIAAVSYSTNPEVVMRFNSVQGTDEVNQEFDGMRYQRGFTYTDKALLLANRDLFQLSTGMRSSVPKLAFVITDGKQTTTLPYTRLSEASRGIKDKGVIVYALGVGSGADRAELEDIASGPEYVFTSSSFRDLQYISSGITRRFCEASTQAPKTTTHAITPTPTTPDPCKTQGCNAPYNIGCRVVKNEAECICPTCPNLRRPVCASDGVQDLSECHLRRQACLADMVVFPAKRGPCDKDCRPLLDIAFIVDSSGSIGRTNWERVKRFLKALISKLDVSPSATHVAAVAYSTNPVVVMRFSNVQDTDEVNRLIEEMGWQRGFTYTDKALALADRDLFQISNGMRPGVAKIAIVITDGKQTKTGVFTSLDVASAGIKNKGVTVYAIGIGNGVDRNELEEIASSPEYVFTSSSFRALQTIAPQIRRGICEDPKTKYSANVLFVMDSSRETASTYNTVKDLVKSLSRFLNINPQGVRAALVVFNGRASVISDFESFRSASDFESTVDSVPHYGGSRSVSDALRTAAGMFPKSPSSVSKVVFLVTAGKPLQKEDGSSVGDVIDTLSAMGVRTYIALIGPSPNIQEFRSSVNNPENVFAIASRSDIPKQINQVGSQVLTDSVTPMRLNLTMYVLFVIDSSAEVTPSNFRQEKEFIKSLISQLNIYPADSGSRVGIMVYSDGATMVLDFQNQESKSSLETIVDNLPHLKGARRIDRALAAATDALRDVDTDDPKFVVLVAGGRQTNQPGSQTFGAAVKPLHNTGTKTHVMAVGDGVDPNFFQADDKNKSNVISVPSFRDLPQEADRLSSELLDDYVAPRKSQTGTPGPTTAEETTPTERSTKEPSQITTAPMKVHGGWGPWGAWSACTKTCGSGTQIQERRCDSPRPDHGGRPCEGPGQQSQACNTRNCPVHGGWGPWGAWSACTKTCGSGTQIQERRCDSPRPEHGGRPCEGPGQKSQACNTRNCPVHGGWGPWGAWSACTKTCGSGTQTQERRCDSPRPDHGGRQCEGAGQQSQACNTRNCPGAVPSPVDIVFLLDTSNGVTQSDLRQQKEFAKRMAQQFGVGPTSSHAAVLSYSDRPRLIGGFYDHLMGRSFDDIVNSVTLTGGRRNIQEVLKQTQRLLTSARPTVPYVVFLITYGQQASELGSQRLTEMVQSVRDVGGTLYLIGVGVDDNNPQLQSVVQRPGDFFKIPSSSDLNSYVPSIAYHVVSRTDATVPNDYKAEVIYVVDSSSFVGPENYRTEKEFVKALARVLNHSPTHTQSSVIIFDSFPETPIRMGSYREFGRFSEAVDNLRYLGGPSSQLGFALTFAARGFSVNRPGVQKIIIVLTNKDPPNRGSIDSLAGILRREGTIVNVIGVGNEANFPNLRRLVVRPEDIFTPKTFDDVMSYVPSVASNILALTTTPTTAPATTTKISTTATTEVTTPPAKTTPSVQTTPQVQTTPSAITTPAAITTASILSTPTTPFLPTPTPKKTGACPVTYTTPCPGDHLCEHDRQCPVDEKCCKHSCGFLSCTKMVQPNKPGSCPYLPRPSSCSSRPRECVFDIDCSGDLKCCDNGCGKICVSTDYTPPTTVQPNKPGSCPYLPRPSSCSTRPRECITDIDCSGDLKCCHNGCGKICVSTDYTPPPIDFVKDKCPPYSPKRQCPSSVQDECTCDSDCNKDDGHKCCFDGCRRFCRKKAGQVCTAKVDIIYLMDSSGSIGAVDFERQKDFVKDLARIFSIGLGASRAAVVTYNDYPTVRSNFGDFGSTDEFAKAVERINQTRGRTRIDRALVKTSEMFKSARESIPKVLIALTDGSQTPDPDAIALDVASQPLRDQNVRVFALGVGHYINVTQLRSMVESNSDVFLVDSFVDLLRKSQTIAEKACSEIVSSCVQGVDIAFLMDSSESITDEDFEREKTAVKEIARRFLRASPDSRAGVIMYSGRPELSINFRSQGSLDIFQSAVDALTHKRSMTRIDLALRYAAESLFLNPRPSVDSIAVVMTDGLQTPGPGVEPLGQAVLPLRSKGVRVLAVGVGPRVNRNELKDLVTSQDDVFQMSSFQELLDKSNQLLEAVCPQPSQSPIMITTKAAATTMAPITTTQITTTQPSTTRAITTTSTTEPDPKCDELFDIVFVMDSSRSINVPQYEQEKNFVKRLATIFNVGAGSRAAVIIYSDDTQLKITFDQYRNLDNFLSAVDALPYLQRRTRIDKALAVAARVLRQARPGFPKAVIVMTDGRQTRDPDAVELDIAADPIHRQGARVLVVGIGPEISQNELRMIAKDPSYVFNVQSFENLRKATRDVAASACINPAVTTTTAPVIKPGVCPVFPLNIRCAVTISSCFTDSDCSGNLKCCYDNCRFICTRPDDNEIVTTTAPLDACPVVTDPPSGSCSSFVSTCLSDEQCSSGFRCCYDGCRFTCIFSVGGITGPTTPLISTTPTAPTCEQAFDLGIAMDSSGSIRDANYQRERNFVKGLADKLVVGPQNVHLGLIVFSDVPIISIRLGTLKSTDRSSFTAAVDGVPYLRGRTRIDSALETAANDLFPEGRQNLAPQVLLVITDGRQSNDAGSVKLVEAVRPLRDQSIKVIVVGIGDDVDEDELKSIVQNPADELFLVASFLELRPLLDNKKLNDALCLQTRGRLRRNRS